MIRKILCFCLLIAAACTRSETVPEGVLSEDEMTSILMEVYVKEAQLTHYAPRISRDSSDIVFNVLKNDILTEYNVEDSTFRESMRWYFERPEFLERVYSRLVDSLTLKVQQQKEVEPERE